MRAPVGTIVLLVLAALLYAAMLGCLAEAPNADAFGQAIVLLYAAFLGDSSQGTYLLNFGTMTPGATSHKSASGNKTSFGRFRTK